MKSLVNYIYESSKRMTKKEKEAIMLQKQELTDLIKELTNNPIKDYYKKKTVGKYSVQRIKCDSAPSAGGWSLYDSNKKTETIYKRDEWKDELYIHIEREINTGWWKETGYMYQCWK